MGTRIDAQPAGGNVKTPAGKQPAGDAAQLPVVICGFTEPRGDRGYFGALVAGMYQGDRLVYVGRIGGGFSRAMLMHTYGALRPLQTQSSPFTEPPSSKARVTWVHPRLVAEVTFDDWTDADCLRRPVFVGLCAGLDPRQCTLSGTRPAKPGVTPMPVDSKNAAQESPVPASKAFSRKNLSGSFDVRTRQHVVSLSSLERVYWPAEGYTKGDLLRYYWQVSKHMLPVLKDRPLILKRYPRGIDAPGFFQHDVDADEMPSIVHTFTAEAENGRMIDYAVCDNRAALLYLANLGCIAQNPWHSRASNPNRPDWVVFDLDPSEAVKFDVVCQVALALKDVLDRLGLEACAKTSGSSGLHIYVPIRPVHSYDQTALLAEQVAKVVARENSDVATVERSKSKRGAAQVYVDHLQNARGKSVVAAYSGRARPGATVSAPLTWREVEKCVAPAEFTIKTMPRRIAKTGDIFEPVLARRQNLERAFKRLEKVGG